MAFPLQSARSWAMSLAQASISVQSRKSPSGSIVRAAGSFLIARSENPSLPGSRAPKKTRWPLGPMAPSNSAISLGSAATVRSRPLASVASVPSGPLLNSQTGLLARTVRFRWTNADASFCQCRRRRRSRPQTRRSPSGPAGPRQSPIPSVRSAPARSRQCSSPV